MAKKKLTLDKISNNNPSIRMSEDFLNDFNFDNFFDIFDNFITLKQLEGLAPRSIQDYINHMNYFKTFIESSTWTIQVRCLNIEVFRAYIHYMVQEKQYKPCTVNIRLRTLKSYLRWLYKENHITDDISYRIKLVKEPKDTIQPLCDSDIKKILKVIDKTTYTGLRDFTLMVLMLDCGIRVGEAINLETKDLDLKSNFINIPSQVAKTRNFRQIPISDKTKKLLKQIIKVAEISNLDYIFQSAYANKLSTDQVIHNFTKYGKLAGVNVKCSPHVFRHTFAVNFIRNNGDVFTLQRILGHSTLEMTRRYVQLTNCDLLKKHRAVSPIDKYLK